MAGCPLGFTRVTVRVNPLSLPVLRKVLVGELKSYAIIFFVVSVAGTMQLCPPPELSYPVGHISVQKKMELWVWNPPTQSVQCS